MREGKKRKCIFHDGQVSTLMQQLASLISWRSAPQGFGWTSNKQGAGHIASMPLACHVLCQRCVVRTL